MDKHSYNIIKIKAKNGTTYAYEDYSYWDKERGYSTHKRRSIGKVLDDGSIAYNKYYLSREESKDVVADVAGESALASSSAVETSEHDSPPVSYTIRVGQKLILDKV